MTDFIYNGTIEIEIQGARVLELVERKTEYANYSVIGFDHTVTVRDYRKKPLEILDSILKGSNMSLFADAFCVPSLAAISIPQVNNIFIQLKDSKESISTHRLWIAVGLCKTMPINKYILQKLVSFEKDSFAFIGFYKIPKISYEESLKPESTPRLVGVSTVPSS